MIANVHINVFKNSVTNKNQQKIRTISVKYWQPRATEAEATPLYPLGFQSA